MTKVRPEQTNPRRGQEGLGTIPAFFVISLSAFLVFLVVAMYATGVAQRYLMPILKAKALDLADTVEGRKPSAAAADSASTAPQDSLRALLTQIETERVALAQEKDELASLRSEIDSVMTGFKALQSSEADRQAILLAKMTPDEAAMILEEMDDVALDAVLSRMTPKAASRVMGRIDPTRLARLAMEGIGADAMAEVAVPPGATAPTSVPPQSGGAQ
ncbi:MAG: hypothetical protein IPK72_15395 [Candidatus Eisenbacteria bacterium]|nr:hypothetical protein [Candidatus Eisenbacteria bacterium]